MYSLVIVDMQPAFEAAKCNVTTDNVMRLIRQAKEDKANIITLEYEGFGPTRADLMMDLCSYDKYANAKKSDDDGSDEAIEAGASMFSKVIVCGVNTSYCVNETVQGLLRNGKEVVVVRDACNNPKNRKECEAESLEFMMKKGALVS